MKKELDECSEWKKKYEKLLCEYNKLVMTKKDGLLANPKNNNLSHSTESENAKTLNSSSNSDCGKDNEFQP